MDESVRRVRRGCVGMAIILLAVIFLLIMSTGNLAWSLLLLLPLALVVLSRFIK